MGLQVRAASWLRAAIGQGCRLWAPHGRALALALAQGSPRATPSWRLQRRAGLGRPVPWGCGLGRTGPSAPQGTGWGWRLGSDLSLGALPRPAVAPPRLQTPAAPVPLLPPPAAAPCRSLTERRPTSADHCPALRQCPPCPHSPLPRLLSLLALSPHLLPGRPRQTGLQGRDVQRKEEERDDRQTTDVWAEGSQGCHVTTAKRRGEKPAWVGVGGPGGLRGQGGARLGGAS